MQFDLSNLEAQVTGFMLVFFRIAGLMLFAPLFGSARIPRRFKVLMALVLTLPVITKGLPPNVPVPQSLGVVIVGLVEELVLGITLGMIVSFVFVAAQWAGEMVGQQIGLNISEVLDPQFGGGGSIVGDLYFMFATVAFLAVGGHLQLIHGVYESFTTCPPLSSFFSPSLLDFVLGYWWAATGLALRIAAPMFITMMIVDVSLGCISKTMPQLNVMSAGMAVRGIVGIVVLALGLATVAGVLSGSIQEHLDATLRYMNIDPLKY